LLTPDTDIIASVVCSRPLELPEYFILSIETSVPNPIAENIGSELLNTVI